MSQGTRRYDEIVTEREVMLPTFVHVSDEPRTGGGRVVPERKVDGAGVGGFSPATDASMNPQPPDAGDEPDAPVGRRIQSQTLFDVCFEKGGNRLRIQKRCSRREERGIDAAVGKTLCERGPVSGEATGEVFGFEFPENRCGADEALFLRADRQHSVIAFESDLVFFEPEYGTECRCDSRESVEIAAVQHAVGVTPGDDGGKRPVFARQGHPEILRGVAFRFKPEGSPECFQVLNHRIFFVGVPEARDAGAGSGGGREVPYGVKEVFCKRTAKGVEAGGIRHGHVSLKKKTRVSIGSAPGIRSTSFHPVVLTVRKTDTKFYRLG